MISQHEPKELKGCNPRCHILGLPLGVVWNFRILRHWPDHALALIKRSSAMDGDTSLSLVLWLGVHSGRGLIKYRHNSWIGIVLCSGRQCCTGWNHPGGRHRAVRRMATSCREASSCRCGHVGTRMPVRNPGHWRVDGRLDRNVSCCPG